jgi:hypothetical protein
MSHLDKLKALLAEKMVLASEPSKPPKGSFDPFDGAPPAHISATRCDLGARYRWLIVNRDGSRREVCCLPEMTRRELGPCYPGAQLLPLPNSAAEAAASLSLSTQQPAMN